MNDALYEQLVTRKSRPMDLVIRILCIAALVVVLCGGMLFIGSLAVLVTILLGVLIYYFVFPKLDVEYEYTLLNHDLEIDAIYSKSKRKKLMTLDIQQLRSLRPKILTVLILYTQTRQKIFPQVQAKVLMPL